MTDKFIPLSVPNLKGNELQYVINAVEDEWVSTGGAFIEEFEKKTAEYVGTKRGVACQSGTAGIHLSLLSHRIGVGDEVIVPALTFIAAVNPVKYVGAEPIFMDCDESLCMDMEKLELFCRNECYMRGNKLVNKHTQRHIKAVILVHVFGNIADMETAESISQKYNLMIIEDATEALGSYYLRGKYKGKYAGTMGSAGVYSYNGNKIITTGGGGMIVSSDVKFADKARYLSTQAKDDPLYYVHEEIGYNYRMTNLQAALGLGQLEQLEDFIQIKKENYFEYKKNDIDLLPFRENTRPNYWFYSYLSNNRDGLIQYLSEKNVQSRPIWNLICELKPYQSSYRYFIEKAPKYLSQIVNIPCSTNLSYSDIRCVAKLIKEFEV